MKKILTISLVAAILIYFAIRVLLLLSDFNATAIPAYELFPMGTMAKDIVDGSGYPILGYCDTHSGGELITGFGAVPFFMIMGQSYMALKMVPLFTGLAVLVVLFYFLRINFSSRAAMLGAFLFALAPTTLVKHSLLAMGNHFEILLPAMLLLLCFYQFHFQGQKKRWLALSAVAAGFCIFHNFSSMLIIASLCLVHFGMRGYKSTFQDLLLVLPFMVLGVLPLILINLGTEGGGATFLEAKFMDKDGRPISVFFERLLDFFTNHIPKTGCFRDFAGIPGPVAGWAWLTCFLLAYLSTLPCFFRGVRILLYRVAGRSPVGTACATGNEAGRDGDESDRAMDEAIRESCAGDRPGLVPAKLECLKIMPLVLYLPLLAAAYSAGDFKLGGYAHPIEVGGYRYFLTHLLFALFLISIQAARMSLTRKGMALRTAGYVLAGAALFTGLFNLGEADLTFSNPPSLGMRYDGYQYSQSARGMFSERTRGDVDKLNQAVKDMEPIYRRQICWGVGYLAAMFDIRPTAPRKGKNRGKFNLETISLSTLLSHVEEAYRIEAAYGVGDYLREQLVSKRLDVKGVVKFFQKNPGIYTPYAVQGLMLRAAFQKTVQTRQFFKGSERLIPRFPKAFAFYLWLGHGMQCGRFLRRGIQEEAENIKLMAARVPPEYQHVFHHGLGMGYAAANFPLELPAPLTEKMAPGARYHMLTGFGAALRRIYGPVEDQTRLEAMDSEISDEEMKAVQAGMAWDNFPKMRDPAFFK